MFASTQKYQICDSPCKYLAATTADDNMAVLTIRTQEITAVSKLISMYSSHKQSIGQPYSKTPVTLFDEEVTIYLKLIMSPFVMRYTPHK